MLLPPSVAVGLWDSSQRIVEIFFKIKNCWEGRKSHWQKGRSKKYFSQELCVLLTILLKADSLVNSFFSSIPIISPNRETAMLSGRSHRQKGWSKKWLLARTLRAAGHIVKQMVFTTTPAALRRLFHDKIQDYSRLYSRDLNPYMLGCCFQLRWYWSWVTVVTL